MERTALAEYDIPVGAGLSCVLQKALLSAVSFAENSKTSQYYKEVKQLWYQDTYR